MTKSNRGRKCFITQKRQELEAGDDAERPWGNAAYWLALCDHLMPSIPPLKRIAKFDCSMRYSCSLLWTTVSMCQPEETFCCNYFDLVFIITPLGDQHQLP